MSWFVLGPGEGPAYDFHGAGVVIKASGQDTAGQLGVMEFTYPPALSVHPHVHVGEDEMFFVLEGELTGFCDDDRWTARAGCFVFVPRDRLHGFTVTSREPARALVITGPSQLDRQIAARGNLSPVPSPQPGSTGSSRHSASRTRPVAGSGGEQATGAMMAGAPGEEAAVMGLGVRPFPADAAGVVSGWATTGEEVLMWCGAAAAPVTAEQISAWAREDGVEPFGLYRGRRLVAYGELWVDDGEAEVELARLIVDPGERGQGLGRRPAAELAALARSRHPRVFLRVHPANIAAQRCYAAAGFAPVQPDQAAAWNAGQPISYLWLSLAT